MKKYPTIPIWLILCILVAVRANLLADGVNTNDLPGLIKLINSQPTDAKGYDLKLEAIKKAATLPKPNAMVIYSLLENFNFTTKEAQQQQIIVNPMTAKKWTVFPARDALLDIGKPVVPVLIDKLRLLTESKERLEYTLFFIDLAGKQCEELMAGAISETEDNTQKANLLECLRIIEKR